MRHGGDDPVANSGAEDGLGEEGDGGEQSWDCPGSVNRGVQADTNRHHDGEEELAKGGVGDGGPGGDDESDGNASESGLREDYGHGGPGESGWVGRTPWSAADAPVGLLAPCKMPISLYRQRDEGVPRGPGGPPRHFLRIYSFGRSLH